MRQSSSNSAVAKEILGRKLIILALVSVLLNLCCMGEPEESKDPAIPHSVGWERPGSHGQAYLADQASCATSCHGEDFSGGFTDVSCYDCHSFYPHLSRVWDPYATHLFWVSNNGDARCATAEGCHTELKGPVFSNPPVDCTTYCHAVP